jgi:hypothetical protein
MTKDLQILFKQAGGYVETDENGNISTYTYDFDPEKFAQSIIMECYQTLINHGYTDAANVLEVEYTEVL